MNTILAELEKMAMLLREISPEVKNIIHMLELIKEVGLDKNSVVLPVAPDRFIERGEACKILKIGSATLQSHIDKGQLTPVYLAYSQSAKFSLNEIMQLMQSSFERSKKLRNKKRGD